MARGRRAAAAAAAALACSAALAGKSAGAKVGEMDQWAGNSAGTTSPPAEGFNSRTEPQRHFVEMPRAKDDPGITIYEDMTFHVGKNKRRPVKAQVAVIKNPRGHVRVVPAKEDCLETNRLHLLTKEHQCSMAMNIGLWRLGTPSSKEDYYNMMGPGPYEYDKNVCAGKLISDGKVEAEYEQWDSAEAFGITEDGKWAFGRFTDDDLADLPAGEKMEQFRSIWNRKTYGKKDEGEHWDLTVTWIVQDGKNAAPSDEDIQACKEFDARCDANGLHKTARSLLGIRANGELVMVTMSGSSGDYDDFFQGTTPSEAAEIMLSLGVVEAVNGDGGGSTTMTASRFHGSGGIRKLWTNGVDVLNKPSDCLKGAVEKAGADDEWFQEMVTGWQPDKFCSRKVADMVCVGNTADTVVRKPWSNKQCDAELLVDNMLCKQTRFCREAYSMWLESDFRDDLEDTYKQVNDVMEKLRKDKDIECKTPAGAAYLRQKHTQTCQGSSDAEDALYHILMTAFLADNVHHYYSGVSGGSNADRADSAKLAYQYMQAGEDSMCSGWDVSDFQACNGDRTSCMAAAVNTINHAVGRKLFQEAWGPYETCGKKWVMTRWGPRKKYRCEEDHEDPSKTRLRDMAISKACNAVRYSGFNRLPKNMDGFTGEDYEGKAWYFLGSSLPESLCDEARKTEKKRVASLAGSVGATSMEAGVVAFFSVAGMACIGVVAAATIILKKRRRTAGAAELYRLPTSAKSAEAGPLAMNAAPSL